MCRIAGIFHPHRAELPAAIGRMTEALRRGGPDGCGVFVDPDFPLALGHRRLAILDLSAAGCQPMHDAQHDLRVSYNGELYNFRALRAELRGLGHTFHTGTDTEVILRAYAEWQTAAFDRFNGMFALALLDRPRRRLYLVRDHAGIKPLYYAAGAGPDRPALIFASEIRGIRALYPRWPENPDWRTFFLTFGHLPEPMTTLAGVTMLPKGHYLEHDLAAGSSRVVRYHHFTIADDIQTGAEAVAALRAGLLAATERQLVSDAPIGLFLSGGIDSSVLTVAAARAPGDRLQTTSLLFDEPGFSEKTYQDAVVAATGARNTAHTLTRRDFEDGLADALEAMDQPTNDGINSYFVSKYARAAGLKVALSGLGADELLGGYPSFDRLRRLALRLGPFGRLLPSGAGGRWSRLAFLHLGSETGRYLFLRGLFAPSDVARLTGTTEAAVWRRLADLPLSPAEDGLPPRGGNRISRLEQHYYMQNQLLRDTDAMSMWHGLEVRVPFLDRDFMQLLWRIAPAVKFDGPRKKHLLVEAFPELPRAVWDRPKQGFTIPFARWFRTSPLFADTAPGLEPYRRAFERGRLSWAQLWVLYLNSL